MSVQVRRRREAAAFLSTFVGAQGELLVDTTNNRVQVHDGATPGGWPAAKLADVIGRTAVVDAAYTALPSDRTIAFTALTAARSLQLPAAAAYPTGTQLLVVDETGACGATRTITVTVAGSDTINGAATAVVALPYGFLAIASNGLGKWTVIDQSTASLAQQAAGAVAITGGTIDGTVLGGTTAAAATFTSVGFSGGGGTAGTTNRIALFGTTYGFGISAGSLDLVASAAFSFYSGGTKVATVTSTGLNSTAIGATTAATVRGTTITATTSLNLPTYTVATLPSPGTAGRAVFCSNARMVTSTGALEAAGAGTGGLVSDNGTAWKVAGTNITAAA